MKSLQESLLDDDILDNTDINKLLKNDRTFPKKNDFAEDWFRGGYMYKWRNKELFKLLNNFGIKTLKEITYLSCGARESFKIKGKYCINLTAVYNPSISSYNTYNCINSKNEYSLDEGLEIAYKFLGKLKDNPNLLIKLGNIDKKNYIEDLIK